MNYLSFNDFITLVMQASKKYVNDPIELYKKYVYPNLLVIGVNLLSASALFGFFFCQGQGFLEDFESFVNFCF
jgi:hypothetical protein